MADPQKICLCVGVNTIQHDLIENMAFGHVEGARAGALMLLKHRAGDAVDSPSTDNF